MIGRNTKGFTIIELTLAMSFVSVLLISIAMLSIQLTNQYSRGVTLKEVSQAGTELSNELARTMRQAQIVGNIGVRTKAINGGGTVLCTGTYSYIANNPTNLDENNTNVIKVGTGGNLVAARFAKVRNLGGSLCDTPSVLDSSKTYVDPDVTELLSGGTRKLVVRNLTLTPNGVPATGPLAGEFAQGRGIYSVELTVGTGVETELASNTTCKTPDDSDSNLEFCAIDIFRFTVRVGSSNR